TDRVSFQNKVWKASSFSNGSFDQPQDDRWHRTSNPWIHRRFPDPSAYASASQRCVHRCTLRLRQIQTNIHISENLYPSKMARLDREGLGECLRRKVRHLASVLQA